MVWGSGHGPPKLFKNGAFWCIFEKNIYFSYTLAMGYLAHEEIFENMLRLMHFGVYFERILDIKWLFSYRNNDIIAVRMLGWFEVICSLKKKWKKW